MNALFCRFRRPCGFFLAALLLIPPAHAAAPASQAVVASDPLANLIAMEQRVAPIIQRLVTMNARWCPVTMAAPGWLLGDRRLYSDAVWPRAQAQYGARDSDSLFIAALDPNGPAARAGLRAGDPVVSINRAAIAPIVATPHARMAAAHALLEKAPAQAPLVVETRDGMTLAFDPPRGCASEFRVEASNNVQAKADGLLVLIFAGMVRFADDDDELATVIAHELAHNILRHRARLDAAEITRGLAQFFGRNARLTKVTEEEADRLSIWLMVGAGYDPAAAVRFWTNYGKRHGGGIFQSPTHPTWRRRVTLVTAEAELVRQMRAADPDAAPPMIANPAVLK